MIPGLARYTMGSPSNSLNRSANLPVCQNFHEMLQPTMLFLFAKHLLATGYNQHAQSIEALDDSFVSGET